MLAALLGAVSAPAAFVCIGEEHAAHLGRLVDGRLSFTVSEHSLENAFGLEADHPWNQADRVALSEDIWADSRRSIATYWRDHSIPDALARALVIFLHDGVSLRGLAGVERRVDGAPFSRHEVDALRTLEPLLLHGTNATRYAAVHVACTTQHPRARNQLSRREREVARLLVEGYSSVNIAARFALSPNTIRTVIRRVYAKLGVFNRADLVREFLTSRQGSA